MTFLEKSYLFNIGQFLFMNIVNQIIYYLYITKTGINKD